MHFASLHDLTSIGLVSPYTDVVHCNHHAPVVIPGDEYYTDDKGVARVKSGYIPSTVVSAVNDIVSGTDNLCELEWNRLASSSDAYNIDDLGSNPGVCETIMYSSYIHTSVSLTFIRWASLSSL